MIVVDTSGLLAYLDVDQQDHAAVRAAVDGDPGPFLLSPFVLAELDYLLATRVSRQAELVLLGEVVDGAYRLEPFGPEDVERAARLIERYGDLSIGLADASLVLLADRARTDRVLTLDERHFRALRTGRGRPFTVLPADA